MTHQHLSKVYPKPGGITTLFFIFAVCLFSCSKKDDNANALFIGTYQGNDCSGNVLPNVVVSSGNNGSAINVTFTIGTGACENSIILIGDVNGKEVVFPSQTFMIYVAMQLR